MAPKKSMLDGDFIESDEDDFSFRDNETEIDVSDSDEGRRERTRKTQDEEDGYTFTHDDKPAKKNAKSDDDEFSVEVVSDVPDKDKGKWVIDPEKDGDPPDADEQELRNYSKDVQKRIKQTTARMHAERRRAEERERELAEAVRIAESLLQRNNQLSELVENGEKVLVGEHKGRIESQLAAAKQAFREAHEAGDVNGQIAAQENMAKAAAALDRVAMHRTTPLPRESEAELRRRFPAPQSAPQIDERTLSWKEKNEWFGNDTVMTAFAMGLDQDLTKRQGIKPDNPLYWKTIDKEMRTRFPEKFDAPRRRSPIVPAAGRQGGADPKRVVLTESQVKLAKRLNVTPEQYARQIYKEEMARRSRDS